MRGKNSGPSFSNFRLPKLDLKPSEDNALTACAGANVSCGVSTASLTAAADLRTPYDLNNVRVASNRAASLISIPRVSVSVTSAS